MKSRISPDPRTSFNINAFPALVEEKNLSHRHATFSISVESSPLALHPGSLCVRLGTTAGNFRRPPKDARARSTLSCGFQANLYRQDCCACDH